jgi:trimeric autotransporter adhesin
VWVTPSFGGSAASTCMFYYNSTGNQMNLLNDAGSAWTSATMSSAGTLANSQCSLDLGSATTVPSGNNFTLSVPVTFKSPFAGAKQVWMYAGGSAANSGWQQTGSYTVSPPVSAVSVTPSTGSGTSRSFQFLYADTAGVSDLATTWVWVAPSFGSAANTCMFYYDKSSSQVRLLNDAGTAWSGAALGSATTLQNNQCSLAVGTTTVGLAGNNLTFTVPVTFKAGFTGTQQVWMYAAGSTANSGWQQLGSWTVQ